MSRACRTCPVWRRLSQQARRKFFEPATISFTACLEIIVAALRNKYRGATSEAPDRSGSAYLPDFHDIIRDSLMSNRWGRTTLWPCCVVARPNRCFCGCSTPQKSPVLAQPKQSRAQSIKVMEILLFRIRLRSFCDMIRTTNSVLRLEQYMDLCLHKRRNDSLTLRVLL